MSNERFCPRCLFTLIHLNHHRVLLRPSRASHSSTCEKTFSWRRHCSWPSLSWKDCLISSPRDVKTRDNLIEVDVTCLVYRLDVSTHQQLSVHVRYPLEQILFTHRGTYRQLLGELWTISFYPCSRSAQFPSCLGGCRWDRESRPDLRRLRCHQKNGQSHLATFCRREPSTLWSVYPLVAPWTQKRQRWLGKVINCNGRILIRHVTLALVVKRTANDRHPSKETLSLSIQWIEVSVLFSSKAAHRPDDSILPQQLIWITLADEKKSDSWQNNKKERAVERVSLLLNLRIHVLW